ncbi:MAG: CRTAC1 family protein [Chthonomonadales bacterium]
MMLGNLVARRMYFSLAGLAIVLSGSGCFNSNVAPQAAPSPPVTNSSFTGPFVFEDISKTTGIQFEIKHTKSPLNILDTIGHGVGIVDFDGDGLMDIILLGPDKVKLFKNLGNHKFQDVTDQSGFKQKGYWCGIAIGDYDNCGRPDVFICGYDCSALYHNEGGGRFTDVTAGSGLEVKPSPPAAFPEWRSSAGFMDIDGDGKLDLYVCRYSEFGPSVPQLCGDSTKPEKYSCGPDAYHPQKGILFKGFGGGKFKDVTKESGMDQVHGRALGVAFFDYDGDGKVDIVVANDEQPGDLMRHKGGMKFENMGTISGTALNTLGHVHGGMGIDTGDYNNDGKMDMFVTTYQNEAKSLYMNLGGGVFQDKALDAGLAEKMDHWVGFGVKFLDYDRDGQLDLAVTSGHVLDNTARVEPGTIYRQPLQLFHLENGVYHETTAQMVQGAPRQLVGRGLATVDLNNRGWLDVIVTDHEGPTLFLKNAGLDKNHFINLQFVGTKSNRDGFGTMVKLTSGGRSQWKMVSNAGSYVTASDPRLFFGVGASDVAESVEIAWPSGAIQILRNLKADHFYRITEGELNPKQIK